MAKALGAVVAALALVTAGVGCAADGSEGSGSVSGAEAISAEQLAGTYEIATPYDLTTTGILPGTVSSTLSALSNFEEHPSQTMLDLMNAAHVPGAGFLDAIPELIRGKVLGYIDDHMVSSLFENVPVVKKVTSLLDDVGGLATNFSLVTTLDIPTPDASGNAKATHSLRGAGYSWDGKDHVLDVPKEIASKLPSVSVNANIVAISPRSKDLELGRLQLEKHGFTIPIGSFAVRAMDQLATERFGADLRGSLGKIVDCDKLADAVSKQCVGVSVAKVCVGHTTELKNACNTGLDLLIGNLKDAMKELDLAFNLDLGVAQMWDALEPDGALDGRADRIDVGFWQAEIKTPGKDKTYTSTFTGHRVTDPSTR